MLFNYLHFPNCCIFVSSVEIVHHFFLDMAPTDQNGILSQNGRDVTIQPLPDIVRARYHTRAASLSPYNFEAQYVPWSGFENEVRKTFETQKWSSSILSIRRAIPNKFDLVNEMFQCGDELSVSGRFVQQVLHVMTAVGRDLSIPIKFGDFKTVYTPEREKQGLEQEIRGGTLQTSQSMSQSEDTPSSKNRSGEDPDFAAINDKDRVKFVGEIKTPWTQDFAEARSMDNRWRRWIGECFQK
jgi:hypothetical protein